MWNEQAVCKKYYRSSLPALEMQVGEHMTGVTVEVIKAKTLILGSIQYKERFVSLVECR